LVVLEKAVECLSFVDSRHPHDFQPTFITRIYFATSITLLEINSKFEMEITEKDIASFCSTFGGFMSQVQGDARRSYKISMCTYIFLYAAKLHSSESVTVYFLNRGPKIVLIMYVSIFLQYGGKLRLYLRLIEL
jgi:hypothetical protein